MPTHAVELNSFGPTAARKHMSGTSPRPKSLTVDLHHHMRIPAADVLAKPNLPAEAHTSLTYSNPKSQAIYHELAKIREEAWTGVDKRLADMDEMQIDLAAVSCAPPQMYYALEASIGAETAQIVNDGIHANIKDHPKRFVGLGTVPLQDTDLALKELDRCVGELGFKGIQIHARCRDEELSAERLEPFWTRCEELGIVIFVHPGSFATPRFSRHHLTNVIGNPLDTTTAIHWLIFDGVMARHPKIKFYMSHGGAFAGAYGARMDHAYGARADCRDYIYDLPSVYLKRMYFDTIVFAVDQLEYLVSKYGPDHVLVGTDYPADMGEYRPIEHVYQAESLSDADRATICGLGALRLMGLDEADYTR